MVCKPKTPETPVADLKLMAPLLSVAFAPEELEVDVEEDESSLLSVFIARHSDCVIPY